MSYQASAYNRTRPLRAHGIAHGMTSDKKGGRRTDARRPLRKTHQPKMRPLVFVVAAEKRFWTSAQFTTFQNALT